jgi:aminoglycoside phosphotransferase (APT) family kinase protein
VVDSRSQVGGYSPGVAERLLLADGRRAFVKAACPEMNPDTPSMHRREAEVAAALPPEAPAPAFLFSYDDGSWVVLGFEDVEGRQPRIPWRADELRRVLDALARLAEALTPSPIDLSSFADAWEGDFRGLRMLLEQRKTGDRLEGLDRWLAENLERAAEAETHWPEASVGETLLHVDVRADNIILAADRVVLVDWPGAAVGAAWIDLLAMLPSVAVQGGPKPWELFDDHPVAQDADPAAVDAIVAALTGFFVERGRRPDPPGLPTVRRFQTAQGIEAARWLERRLGIGTSATPVEPRASESAEGGTSDHAPNLTS